jgi:hypothetical protein
MAKLPLRREAADGSSGCHSWRRNGAFLEELSFRKQHHDEHDDADRQEDEE